MRPGLGPFAAGAGPSAAGRVGPLRGACRASLIMTHIFEGMRPSSRGRSWRRAGGFGSDGARQVGGRWRDAERRWPAGGAREAEPRVRGGGACPAYVYSPIVNDVAPAAHAPTVSAVRA
ncbi:hypothetical protein AMYX_16300 [Anaeromyxobacter diazotrophicus]|uniref:Uncharacterized protein n=1 Tax=Anaeromyxobacter diazotrophicus TaxID=2590199 RepID=A0A7I9VLA7_9BACT|nr:hypothetical protein AMYX_16300 [Anaeromyxobacter diazotrophicus]